MIAFDGVLHDGRATTAVPVEVEAGDGDVEIFDGTVTARLPRVAIAADAPIPGVPRVLRLPSRVEVAYDLMTGTVMAEDTAEIALELAPASTRLFYVGPRKALARLDGVL